VLPRIVLAPGKVHEVELVLGSGGVVLSGRVLDAGGGPVAGARVTARPGYPFGGGLSSVFQATADAEGRYQLRLPAREYHVRAAAGGYAPREGAVALTREVVRDFVLSPAGRISGRVIERGTGAPVAGALLFLAFLSPGGWALAAEGRADVGG
jgi:hypothetical protein